MKDLIDYMEKRVKNDSYFSYSHPKMVIQGGHDTTINLIQLFMFTAFNIPVKYVKFGAHIYFELHEDDFDNKKFTVKYFYDGEKLLDEDYYQFKKRIKEVIWSDEKIKEFCFRDNNNKESDESDKTFSIDNIKLTLIITNSVFFISTIVFLALFIYYKKKLNNSERISVEPFVAQE